MKLGRNHWSAIAALLMLLRATALASAATAALDGVPGGPWPVWLPRYAVNMDLDLPAHCVHVQLRATWTNPQPLPTQELVFNAHSRYVVPKSDIGLTAKTLELLRLAPDDALGVHDPALDIQRISLPDANGTPLPLAFRYEGDTRTTLVVPLPRAVGPGESVTVLIELTMHLPPKQGRWGQWQGVTTLSNWLPVFAYYGPPRDFPTNQPAPLPVAPQPACSWQPTPFVPWHQPFFNEAAHYRVRATLAADQQIACSGSVVAAHTLADGRQQVDIVALGVRDFAFLCSARYRVVDGVVAVPGEVPNGETLHPPRPQPDGDTLHAPRPIAANPSPPTPLSNGVRGENLGKSTSASSPSPNTNITRAKWCASPPKPSPPTASGSAPIPGRSSPLPNRSSAGTATSVARSS